MTSITYTGADTNVYRTEFVYRADNFLAQIRRYENSTLVDDTRIVRDILLASQDRNAGNQIVREYTWGINYGGGIGGLLNMRHNAIDYEYLYDGKGDVAAVVDSTQNAAAAYRYDSFGRVVSKAGTIDQPFQFSTKRYLADAGLSYYGYRYYSAASSRWMTRDPIEEAGGINLYGFALNNPVNYIDPWGLKDRKPKGGSYGFNNGILGLGASMQASLNKPSRPIRPGEWDAIINLLDNISNFFPGPKIMVPPYEIFKKECPQNVNG